MKFELEIDCDNDAFAEDPAAEIARILAGFASRIRDDYAGACGKPGEDDDGNFRDLNGNCVGVWKWEGSQ